MTPDDASSKLLAMSLVGAVTVDCNVMDELIATSEVRWKYKQNDLRKWRVQVLKRDDHECQMCGATERLEAHHIRPKALYPDLALQVTNGVALCFVCHRYCVHGGNSFDLSNWSKFIPLWESL